MDAAEQVAAVGPALAFCVGGGLVRRQHRAAGAVLLGGAFVAASALAIFASWRPALGLIAAAGFLLGLEVDRPGSPARCALGLLGVGIGLFALLIASLYA